MLARAVACTGFPRFILISTDKALRPNHVMGASISGVAQMVPHAALLARGGDFFLLDISELMPNFDLAKQILRLNSASECLCA